MLSLVNRALGVGLTVLFCGALAACGSVKNDEPEGTPDAAPAVCPVCDPNATCQGTTCVCNDGWEGTGESCSDVDECATDNGGCDPIAACTNTDGSRTCACPADAFGDGLTCRQKWVLAGSFAGVDIDPENFGSKATGAAGKLFFGAEANGAGVPFMRSYDVDAGTLSGLLALPTGQSDFCACGLTDVFVGIGLNLLMMGNNGMQYVPGQNVWTTISSYIDPNRRGEAAAAHDMPRRRVYLVGGRDHETDAIQLDLTTFAFTSIAGTVPFPANQARAWVFSGDQKLYLAGGSSAPRKLAAFAPDSGPAGWTVLPDSPNAMQDPLGMGEFQGKIWVATGGSLQIFDPGAGQWHAPVPTPMGVRAAAMVGDATYVLCKTASGLEIYRLNAIE